MTTSAEAIGLARAQAAIAELNRAREAYHPKEFERTREGAAQRDSFQLVKDKLDVPYQAIGRKVENEHPYACEDVAAFHARLLAPLQTDGRRWTPNALANLGRSDEAKFQEVEQQVIDKAWKAACAPGMPLMPITREDQSGRQIIENWAGHKGQWMGEFKAPAWLMTEVNGRRFNLDAYAGVPM
ncbi:hypothetical protein PQQ75_04185 [Paraburkholderia aspalathi]|uniref:hypothetical protein n=1 Tax=Paraburkholderia aspalathi TaxID=1324617 RepID=UPI0038BB1E61